MAVVTVATHGGRQLVGSLSPHDAPLGQCGHSSLRATSHAARRPDVLVALGHRSVAGASSLGSRVERSAEGATTTLGHGRVCLD